MKLAAAILALICLTAAALSGCVGESESGEHREGAESGEHREGAESGGEGDGEESGRRYALTDTYDETRAGARLILSYDASANAFVGEVRNETGSALNMVRVEVHLSNGTELGPTVPVDLAPGDSAEISLPAADEPFDSWSAHPEVG